MARQIDKIVDLVKKGIGKFTLFVQGGKMDRAILNFQEMIPLNERIFDGYGRFQK
jgi:hypothetical protein